MTNHATAKKSTTRKSCDAVAFGLNTISKRLDFISTRLYGVMAMNDETVVLSMVLFTYAYCVGRISIQQEGSYEEGAEKKRNSTISREAGPTIYEHNK